MKVIETDGIVLKTMDFKEKDCILTFLTTKAGKKAGILHGGKSLRSGNAAKAELFVLNHFEFSEKPNMDLVRIRKCELQETDSRTGGGALPELPLESAALVLCHPNWSSNELQVWFRSQAVPVIVRIHDDKIWLDFRTILPHDTHELLNVITQLIAD